MLSTERGHKLPRKYEVEGLGPGSLRGPFGNNIQCKSIRNAINTSPCVHWLLDNASASGSEFSRYLQISPVYWLNDGVSVTHKSSNQKTWICIIRPALFARSPRETLPDMDSVTTAELLYLGPQGFLPENLRPGSTRHSRHSHWETTYFCYWQRPIPLFITSASVDWIMFLLK